MRESPKHHVSGNSTCHTSLKVGALHGRGCARGGGARESRVRRGRALHRRDQARRPPFQPLKVACPPAACKAVRNMRHEGKRVRESPKHHVSGHTGLMSEVPLHQRPTTTRQGPKHLPHGAARFSHQKSTCLHTIEFRASCALNFVTPCPQIGGPGDSAVPRETSVD